MNISELTRILNTGETLAVEFKSDLGLLPDAELVEAVVCLANARGGSLLVGVEDDGSVTGLHARHQTQPGHLAAFIASRTVPPVSVQLEFLSTPTGSVAVISVPVSQQTVATSDGKLVIRYIDSQGRPGCRPLYPHELVSRAADRGQADF